MYGIEDLKAHPVWRHVATDSLYHVAGCARDSTNGPGEGTPYVVYFSMTYQTLNVRKASEFLDGRFRPEPPRKG